MNKTKVILGLIALIALVVLVFKKVMNLTTEYDHLFIKYANKHGLDWKMLKAIALNESTLGKNKGYEPKGGTVGLMQIKLSTARDYYPNLTDKDMMNDEIQVMSASAFLRDLLNKTKDVKKAVMSYNQGLGNTLKGKTYADPYWAKYLKHYDLIS